MESFFVPASEEKIKREREKARQLKKTNWWKKKLNQGQCYYCGKDFDPAFLTMDHLVPVVRGGQSIKNNLVVACRKCNSKKKHKTLVEIRLQKS